MKYQFDHRHYVPVLRFRRGEKVAMRQLHGDSQLGVQSKATVRLA